MLALACQGSPLCGFPQKLCHVGAGVQFRYWVEMLALQEIDPSFLDRSPYAECYVEARDRLLQRRLYPLRCGTCSRWWSISRVLLRSEAHALDLGACEGAACVRLREGGSGACEGAACVRLDRGGGGCV